MTEGKDEGSKTNAPIQELNVHFQCFFLYIKPFFYQSLSHQQNECLQVKQFRYVCSVPNSHLILKEDIAVTAKKINQILLY